MTAIRSANVCRIARLTAERKPLKLDPIVAFLGHLSNMSNLSRSRFNSLAEIF